MDKFVLFFKSCYKKTIKVWKLALSTIVRTDKQNNCPTWEPKVSQELNQRSFLSWFLQPGEEGGLVGSCPHTKNNSENSISNQITKKQATGFHFNQPGHSLHDMVTMGVEQRMNTDKKENPT